MDRETREAFSVLADGLFRVEMTLQLHLKTLETVGPGPVDKHQLARLLRDLENQISKLHATVKGIATVRTSNPEDATQVRPDLADPFPQR